MRAEPVSTQRSATDGRGGRGPSGRWACAAVVVLGLTGATAAQFPGPPPAEQEEPPEARDWPPSPEGDNVVAFQPHVRINWTKREIEVDAEVVLREGQLELFGCSPHTREHESIVRVLARPMYIFQALGLMGLEPGHPARRNPETHELEAARGDPVEIEVRYIERGRLRQHPIESWMRQVNPPNPLPRQPWVFAGSFIHDDGRYAADGEGTVIAVVDFPDALVALPTSYTSDDRFLWLEPFTERIPPRETPCVLVFRRGALLIELDRNGRIRVHGRSATLAGTGRVVRAVLEATPEHRFRLVAHRDAPESVRASLKALLARLGVPDDRLEEITGGGGEPAAHEPAALETWIRRRLGPDDDAPRAGVFTRWTRQIERHVERLGEHGGTLASFLHQASEQLADTDEAADAEPVVNDP